MKINFLNVELSDFCDSAFHEDSAGIKPTRTQDIPYTRVSHIIRLAA